MQSNFQSFSSVNLFVKLLFWPKSASRFIIKLNKNLVVFGFFFVLDTKSCTILQSCTEFRTPSLVCNFQFQKSLSYSLGTDFSIFIWLWGWSRIIGALNFFNLRKETNPRLRNFWHILLGFKQSFHSA